MATTIQLGGRDLPPPRTESKRKVHFLPLEKLRPSIRIAHREKGTLNIPERVILDHELVLILEGDGILTFGSGAIHFKEHDLFFIPPFVRHTFTTGSGVCAHLAVHFDMAAQFPAFAAKLVRRPPYEVRFTGGLSLPRHTALKAGDPIHSWLAHLVTLFKQVDPLPRLQADALLLNVLARLLEGCAGGSHDDFDPVLRVRLSKALDYIETHLQHRIAPADLARAAGLSTSHFARVFRRWTGLPPHEYVLRRRVEAARALLGNVNLSIKEVAACTGFDDPYYFSKVFRRIDGLPPTQFRQSLLVGNP
jgi:AraC-like DNA-binding protein